MTPNAPRGASGARRPEAGPAATPGGPWTRMWQVRGPDGTIATGWYLLPLRLFLGVTFLFAGLQKLANPDFFRSSSPDLDPRPAGRHGAHQSRSVRCSATCGASPGHRRGHRLGEVAVGVGALLGLLTRVAAVGGMLCPSACSWPSRSTRHPYYTGSDIVFVFAWTPLALAGAAGAPGPRHLARRPAGRRRALGDGSAGRRDVPAAP